MDKNNAKDFLPLVQALAEGKTIQYRKLSGEWIDAPTPPFHSHPDLYRIKPEPAVLWLVYDSRDRFRGTFESEAEATKYSGYVTGLRVVKLVESQD